MKKNTIYIFLFFIVILLLRLFLISVYRVQHNSMKNTYYNGDWVILLKNIFTINRNDVLIFTHDKENLIKRCIGLPGETIKIVNGKILINNSIIQPPPTTIIEKYSASNIFTKSMIYKSYGTDWTPNNLGAYLIPYKGMKIKLTNENLSHYKNIIKLESNMSEIKENSSYVFKNDYYFFIGDNRKVSIDSRFFGPIKYSCILGKVMFSLN